MQVLPHEEVLNSPLNNLVISNRRIRYMPNENYLQSMSLQEICFMGIIKVENSTYRTMASLFTVLSVMSLLAIVYGQPMGRLLLMGFGGAAVIFYLLYLGSRETTLRIQSRGGATISIVLSNKNVMVGKDILETVEEAKLNLE